MGKKKSIQETIIIVPDDIQCEKRSSKPQSFLQDNKLEIIAPKLMKISSEIATCSKQLYDIKNQLENIKECIRSSKHITDKSLTFGDTIDSLIEEASRKFEKTSSEFEKTSSEFEITSRKFEEVRVNLLTGNNWEIDDDSEPYYNNLTDLNNHLKTVGESFNSIEKKIPKHIESFCSSLILIKDPKIKSDMELKIRLIQSNNNGKETKKSNCKLPYDKKTICQELHNLIKKAKKSNYKEEAIKEMLNNYYKYFKNENLNYRYQGASAAEKKCPDPKNPDNDDDILEEILK
ncbi:MAG: hypothetical protein MJZ87_03325 [Bacteroidales bacterium]|nr:hypothetical protein [Bacteroidales bacterium]